MRRPRSSHERGGVWGTGRFPTLSRRRGQMGETWFPPSTRAEGECCSGFRPPHDDRAAQAQAAGLDPSEPGFLPPPELALERVPRPELPDRPAQEVAHLPPAVRQHLAREGEAALDVELPERLQRPRGDAELERCNGAARANDTRELLHRRRGVVHVAEEIRDREVVERVVLEGHVLGGRLDELDAVCEALPRDPEHVGALVEPRHLEAAAEQLGRDEARPCRHIENVPAGWESRNEEASPERILAERQCRPDAVVGGPERSEEGAGVAGPLGHAFYSGRVSTLAADLEAIAERAVTAYARAGDRVSAVLPTEPTPGQRVYLVAFDDADGYRSWVALDGEGDAVTATRDLREAIAVAVLCEVAADAAAGGDVDGLIASLEELRLREAPEGIENAEAAA